MSATEYKTCKICRQEKSIQDFPVCRSKKGQTYTRSLCKTCRKEYESLWKDTNYLRHGSKRKEYYEKNKEKIIKRVKKWQEENKVHRREYNHGRYLKNKPRIKEAGAVYYRENIEKIKLYVNNNRDKISERMKTWRKEKRLQIEEYNLLWRRAHLEHIKEYSRRYRIKNPMVKRLAESKRRAQKKSSSAEKIHPSDIQSMLKIQCGRCTYCSKDISKEYQIDHILPLNRGGPHTLNNIQLLCAFCNGSKKTKTHEEFLHCLSKPKASI